MHFHHLSDIEISPRNKAFYIFMLLSFDLKLLNFLYFYTQSIPN